MGIVVIGAVFVDIKGYPLSTYIPGGRNAGRVEQVHGGVCRNVAEDIANVELRPTFVSLVDDTGSGQDVIDKLAKHKVNTKYIEKVPRRNNGQIQACNAAVWRGGRSRSGLHARHPQLPRRYRR